MKSRHRMVLPALAAWLSAALLVGIPDRAWPVAIVGAIATSGCAAAAARLHGRRGSGWCALAALTALAASLAAVSVAAREPARTPEPLTAASGRPVTVRLTVTDKAVIDDRRSRTAWDRSTDADPPPAGVTAQRVRGTVTELEVGDTVYGVSVPALLFATIESDRPVPIGSVVEAPAMPRPTAPGDGAAVLLFATGRAEVVAVPPGHLAWAGEMRTAFVERAAALPGNGGQLLPGLAVGDTTAVGDALDEAMKTSSLSHLTAVSGANCAVIVAVLSALFAVLGAPRRWRVAGSLAGLGLFVVLVTPEPSVVRAALMALAVLLARAAGRPAAGLPVLSLVVLGVVIADPWLSRNYGFVLSALATAGLLVLTRPFSRFLANWLPRWIAAAVSIPLAAQVACQPVLILLSPVLPVLGVPANLLAAPAAPVATLLGLLACVLAPAGPVADLALWLGWLPATWIAAIATTVDSLPAANLPWLQGAPGALLLAGLSLVLLVGLRATLAGRRRIAGLCAAALVVAAGAYTGTLAGQRLGPALSLPQDWSVAACDVGQGDAVLVRSAESVALIDTGPDPGPLLECLDDLSIGRIDLLILTHFDLDHIGGVAGVLGRAGLVLTGEPDNAADERLLSDLAAAGATVRRVTAGDEGRLGESGWRALWPPPRAGDRWTGNAASVTLVFEPDRADGIRSLFLGDLGEPSQESVLAGHRLGGDVDIVKMAHHGSADQSPRLYQAASARIGLVPVGADNDYGHPTEAALAMLTAAGTAPFRTDTCGHIVVGGTAADPVVWTERAC